MNFQTQRRPHERLGWFYLEYVLYLCYIHVILAPMDKETEKFIESALKAQTEDIASVLRDVMVSIDTRMGSMETKMGLMEGQMGSMEVRMNSMDTRLQAVEEEVHETRVAVLRIEHTLQDKQEAQGDLIQDTRQRVERIENHLHLPHSLSVPA